MKFWIDIDNPPQVQYLLPVRRALEATDAETIVTARDYGPTLAMLRSLGVRPQVFGTRVGASKVRKAAAVLARAAALERHFARTGRPDVLLAASRSAAVAARFMGVPSFIISDYEYAHIELYRHTASTFLHPDVINPKVWTSRGIPPERVLAFHGLKEDLTFADVDVDAVAPHDLGRVDGEAVRVLFRPPSETSHYYDAASTRMARATLEHLARRGALVIYAPRDPSQVVALQGLPWVRQPIVLERPVPFLSLLKSADAVVCSGGTMLREAAYLGIPAYSIFKSEIGAVDRWLASIGRATLLAEPRDLVRMALRRRGLIDPLNINPGLVEELVSLLCARAAGQRRRPSGPRSSGGFVAAGGQTGGRNLGEIGGCAGFRLPRVRC